MKDEKRHEEQGLQPIEDGPWRVEESSTGDVWFVHAFDGDEVAPWHEVVSPPRFFTALTGKTWGIRIQGGEVNRQRAVFGVSTNSKLYPKQKIGTHPGLSTVSTGFHAIGFYELEARVGDPTVYVQTGYLEVIWKSAVYEEHFYINPMEGLFWPNSGLGARPKTTWTVTRLEERPPSLPDYKVSFTLQRQ
jgi:hypothetical protein